MGGGRRCEGSLFWAGQGLAAEDMAFGMRVPISGWEFPFP